MSKSAVAGDAEGVGSDHFESREEHVEVGRHDLFDPDEIRRLRIAETEIEIGVGLVLVGNRQQAREALWHLDASEALALVGVADDHREVDRQVGDVRKGVARVEGERSQGREDVALEVPSQQLALLLLQLVVGQDVDVVLGQGRHQLVPPTGGGLFEHRLQGLVDRRQLLGGAHAVGRRVDHAGLELAAQSRNTDHEEFIEVR